MVVIGFLAQASSVLKWFLAIRFLRFVSFSVFGGDVHLTQQKFKLLAGELNTDSPVKVGFASCSFLIVRSTPMGLDVIFLGAASIAQETQIKRNS